MARAKFRALGAPKNERPVTYKLLYNLHRALELFVSFNVISQADELVSECKRFLSTKENDVSPLLVWALADIYSLKDFMKETARADTLR